MLRFALALAFLPAWAIGPITQRAEPLIGTWRLVRYEIWQEGRIEQPLGARPVGYVVFDPTGHAFVQITADSVATPTKEDRAGLFGAYFGTYTIRRTQDSATVSIRVEGANDAAYLGTVQDRPFDLRSDSLTLGVPGVYRATFTRVRE